MKKESRHQLNRLQIRGSKELYSIPRAVILDRFSIFLTIIHIIDFNFLSLENKDESSIGAR